MVNIEPLNIHGAYVVTPRLFSDERGVFLESFRRDRLAELLGHPLQVMQTNTSVSARGVLRGIHFADVPRGQAKYVSVLTGSIIDYVVDIRLGSPTFGESVAVPLDATVRRSLYLAEGLGHAFVALEDNTTVNYLVSDVFRPDKEHGIHPLDSEINLELPGGIGAPLLSPKDSEAPTLQQAAEAGLLPTWDDCLAYYQSMQEGAQ